MWPFISGFFHLTMFWRLVHIVACVVISFLFYGQYSVNLPHFYNPSVDGHLYFTFWLLYMMMLWTVVYQFLYEPIFSSLGYITRCGIAGSYINVWLFEAMSNCFHKQLHYFTFPPAYVKLNSFFICCAKFPFPNSNYHCPTYCIHLLQSGSYTRHRALRTGASVLFVAVAPAPQSSWHRVKHPKIPAQSMKTVQ